MPDKNCLKMADNRIIEYLNPLRMNVSGYSINSVEREIFVKKFLKDEH